MECRLAYSREWAIRMSHESRMHKQSCMLNLTYDDAHLPSDGQVNKKHLQDFFKRLRHHYTFRYVAAGEYGERRGRPHYHIILFGVHFDDQLFWGNSPGSGLPLYTSATLARFWTFGLHTIGAVTFDSCAYVARYITKKATGAARKAAHTDPETGEITFWQEPFLLCSKSPGIGYDWLKRYGHSDMFVHGRVVTDQGTPAPIPRFYKRKIADDKRLAFELTQRIALNQDTSREALRSRRNEDTNSRRAQRAVYAAHKSNLFARDKD